MNTATILNFINTNIKTLRPLVKDLEANKAKLETVRVEQTKIGNSILAEREWLSDSFMSKGERITEHKHAWDMEDGEFTEYCIKVYEEAKQSEVIRELIPNIDSLDYDKCLEWIFNSQVINASKLLLEMFDKSNNSNLSRCYDLVKRDQIIEAICEAVKAYRKP